MPSHSANRVARAPVHTVRGSLLGRAMGPLTTDPQDLGSASQWQATKQDVSNAGREATQVLLAIAGRSLGYAGSPRGVKARRFSGSNDNGAVSEVRVRFGRMDCDPTLLAQTTVRPAEEHDWYLGVSRSQ
jgi:hypothetical protein